MCGELLVAGVGVVVILRQQVHVVQEDAAPVFVSEGLPHPDVQQLGSVKSTVPPLKKHDITDISIKQIKTKSTCEKYSMVNYLKQVKQVKH